MDSTSSDDQLEVPDFPTFSESDLQLKQLSLKFRWRDVSECFIKALYSQSLRQKDVGLAACDVKSPVVGGKKLVSPASSGTVDGHHLISVSDVVWGKIRGFPWWPAKVTGLRVLEDSSCARGHEAHLSWFGSTTTSILDPAYLQPFLTFYKQRYIHKKRGPYKVAVKQALSEAEKQCPSSTQVTTTPSQKTNLPVALDQSNKTPHYEMAENTESQKFPDELPKEEKTNKVVTILIVPDPKKQNKRTKILLRRNNNVGSPNVGSPNVGSPNELCKSETLAGSPSTMTHCVQPYKQTISKQSDALNSNDSKMLQQTDSVNILCSISAPKNTNTEVKGNSIILKEGVGINSFIHNVQNITSKSTGNLTDSFESAPIISVVTSELSANDRDCQTSNCSNILPWTNLNGNFSTSTSSNIKEPDHTYQSKQGTKLDDSVNNSATMTVSSVFNEEDYDSFPRFKTSKVGNSSPVLNISDGIGHTSLGIDSSSGIGCFSENEPYSIREAVPTIHKSPFIYPSPQSCSSRPYCSPSGSQPYGSPSAHPRQPIYTDCCSPVGIGFSGGSPDVENSPGEPLLGCPAPSLLDSSELPDVMTKLHERALSALDDSSSPTFEQDSSASSELIPKDELVSTELHSNATSTKDYLANKNSSKTLDFCRDENLQYKDIKKISKLRLKFLKDFSANKIAATENSMYLQSTADTSDSIRNIEASTKSPVS